MSHDRKNLFLSKATRLSNNYGEKKLSGNTAANSRAVKSSEGVLSHDNNILEIKVLWICRILATTALVMGNR